MWRPFLHNIFEVIMDDFLLLVMLRYPPIIAL
jgi:hypothetical protein